jgi:DNA processing protein
MDARTAYFVLALLPGIGPRRIQALLSVFGGPEKILTAPESELRKVVGAACATVIARWKRESAHEEEESLLRQRGWNYLTWADEAYPALLRQIHSPPLMLEVWGEVRPEDFPAVAVVGTRRATPYGRDCARLLTRGLVESGYTIVSGLALGIDTVAHEEAMALGGRTLAVLGSGLADIYPKENQALAERIAGHGAVLSQYPCRTQPDARQFPQRNHTVSGMSHGLLVVEGNARSGSMLTAVAAMEQGRQVFAVPGPINRQGSIGPHRLIQDGAKLVMTVEDMVCELPEPTRSPSVAAIEPAAFPPDLNGDELKVYEVLDLEGLSIDSIAEKTDLPSARVSSTLLRLEIRQLIRKNPGMTFSRRH